MGGSSSKTKSTIIAEAVNEAAVNSMQTCNSNLDLTQEIVVKGQGNVLSNIQMNQVYSSVMTCVNNTSWMSKFQNDLSAAVKQSAESQSVALIGVLGDSDAEVDNYIRNSVKNSVNVSTMTSLVNNVKQKQSIYVEGVGNTLLNISMKQMNTNISSSTQELIGSMDVINKIAASVDQKSKATQEDPIANLLAGLANLLSGPIMWVAIMIIGGLIVFAVFLNSGAGQALMDEGFKQADAYGEAQGLNYNDSSPDTVVDIPEPSDEPVQESTPEPTPVYTPEPVDKRSLGETTSIDTTPINLFENQRPNIDMQKPMVQFDEGNTSAQPSFQSSTTVQ